MCGQQCSHFALDFRNRLAPRSGQVQVCPLTRINKIICKKKLSKPYLGRQLRNFKLTERNAERRLCLSRWVEVETFSIVGSKLGNYVVTLSVVGIHIRRVISAHVGHCSLSVEFFESHAFCRGPCACFRVSIFKGKSWAWFKQKVKRIGINFIFRRYDWFD